MLYTLITEVSTTNKGLLETNIDQIESETVDESILTWVRTTKLKPRLSEIMMSLIVSVNPVEGMIRCWCTSCYEDEVKDDGRDFIINIVETYGGNN